MELEPVMHTDANGTRRWFVNQQLHRLDGPAVIYSDGNQEWWIHNRGLTDHINSWITARGVSWPWDEDVQTEFLLTWS